MRLHNIKRAISKRIEVRPSDPMLTNRWGNVALGIIWLIDGLWGFFSSIHHIPTLSYSTPPWYEVMWSTGMTVAGLTAAFGCFLVFFKTPWLTLLNKKRVELYSLYWLIGFMSIYIVLLYYYGFFADTPDSGRASLAVAGTQFLVMPVYRIYQLNRRIRTIIASHNRVESR